MTRFLFQLGRAAAWACLALALVAVVFFAWAVRSLEAAS